MPRRGWKWLVFVAVSAATGFGYWWHADWWAYVDSEEGPMPKFTMPWWWQLTESGAVGATTGGLVVGVLTRGLFRMGAEQGGR